MARLREQVRRCLALAGEAAPQRGVSPDRIVLRLPRARALSPLKVAPR